MHTDMERQVDALFAPQGKVYCGDCHWYLPPLAPPAVTREARCRHPQACASQDTYAGVRLVRVSPEERNAHNDCQDWRQKTFFSDFAWHPGKRGMVLLAVIALLVWGWRLLAR